MLNQWISTGTVLVIIEQLGYVMDSADQEIGYYKFRHYNNECGPITLFFGPLTKVPLGMVERLLRDRGINIDSFHAALESL